MPDIFLVQDGNQTGPHQPDQVRQLLAQGKVTATTPAWHEGMSEWGTVGSVLPPVPASGPPPVPASLISPPPPPPVQKEKGMHGCLLAVIIVACAFGGLFVLSCLASIALGPIAGGIHKAKESQSMQVSREIGLAMFAYANDHNGAYPDGKTSTEVFQKLLDGKYITDPGTFYLQMEGKTKATSPTLTAANVCYDVTSGVTGDSSDQVPVVFCTGYTVTYSPGASAVRDPSSATPFPGPDRLFRGLAVTYKGNNARFITAGDDGSVAEFIPANFDAGGKTYQQLRP